jgi:ABC-type Fe3+-hydroxamate transport system substrate-binding protein
MISNTDQMGNVIQLKAHSKSIISLVPSQTELLYYLGLEEEVIGITKFCVHPQQWFKNKTRVGGTKAINIEKIKTLKPDLVIANKEENVKEQIEALKTFAPVWISDINNLDDALEMIEKVSLITGKSTIANLLIQQVKNAFLQINLKSEQLRSISGEHTLPGNIASSNEKATPSLPPVKIAYLIWQNPYMTVGGDTFIGDMIRRCGLQNVFEDHYRYPVITPEEIQNSGCDIVLLSSEPFPFTQKHIEALQMQMPTLKMLMVDGEMFSWYGSRLLPAAVYFKELKATINSLI